MARFLSDEWIEEMAAAVGDENLSKATPGVVLSVQQVVHTDDDVVRYWLRLDDGAISIGRGVLGEADVTFETDRTTAAGLARGSLSVHDAITTGGLRITGDVTLMIRQAAELARIDDAFADVRARTSYD